MPTYVYAYLDDAGQPTDECFEVVQSISEDALKKHEGRKVQRVPQAPNIAGKWSDIKGKSALSNKNLERLGFTKYEKRGDGYMERTAGKAGPRAISAEE
jgi:predicted nucleic acid-binding Zn ribbon protein